MPGYPSDTLNVFSAEPEPFRRDEIKGRDFEYSDESFLHRFNYRLRTDWQRLWDGEREGFVITAGSVRSDELYVVNLLRKTIPFDNRFFGVLRYERSEDFDSRYDRFLTGAGVNLGAGWALSLMGDVVAEKADIDPQVELTWNDGAGNRFRFAFLAVDHFYNEKTDEHRRYERQPYTWFVEGKWQATERLAVSAWVNWNPELVLELQNDGEFKYEQFMQEVAAAWVLNSNWELFGSVGSQYGYRRLTSVEHAAPVIERLDRYNAVVTFETQRKYSTGLKSFHGAHYFFLEEKGEYREMLPAGGPRERHEYMVYGGLIWQASNTVVLAPGLYLDFINNHETDEDEHERWLSRHRMLGKLAIPVEYHFSPRAMMTWNTTMELHKASFGGFNMQFLLLFWRSTVPPGSPKFALVIWRGRKKR